MPKQTQADRAAIQAMVHLPEQRRAPSKTRPEIRKPLKRRPEEVVQDWWINLTPQERLMESMGAVFPPAGGVLKIAGLAKTAARTAKLSNLFGTTSKPSKAAQGAFVEAAKWPQQAWTKLRRLTLHDAGSDLGYGHLDWGAPREVTKIPVLNARNAADLNVNPYADFGSRGSPFKSAASTTAHEFGHVMHVFPELASLDHALALTEANESIRHLVRTGHYDRISPFEKTARWVADERRVGRFQNPFSPREQNRLQATMEFNIIEAADELLDDSARFTKGPNADSRRAYARQKLAEEYYAWAVKLRKLREAANK